MIDIKFLRENPDVVKENIKKKFQDAKLPLVDELIELDLQSRQAKRLTMRSSIATVPLRNGTMSSLIIRYTTATMQARKRFAPH